MSSDHVILKFQLNGTLLLIAYQCVYGLVVVFLQFPSLLFSILLSFIIKLYEYIWVVWFSTSKPNTFQIKSFVFIW